MGKLIAIVSVAVLALIALLYITGVRGDFSVRQPVDGQKMKIGATIFPVYDITRRIGGDKIDVVRILPAGASPHTFELTSSKFKELQGAVAVFKIGGIDDWADDASESLGVEIFSLREGINIRDYSVLMIGEEEEESGSGDPHYWTTMPNAKIIAREITEKISSIDPENAAYYSDNLANFGREADLADAEIRYILKDAGGRSIIAFHGAWNYFAEEYGLKVAASFEPSPGKEPSVAHLIALSDLVKKENIRSIFSEPAFSDDLIRSFMGDMGLKLYILYPEDSASGEASYIETMITNAKIIAEGLAVK